MEKKIYCKPTMDVIFEMKEDILIESTYQTGDDTTDNEKIPIKPGVPDGDDWVSAKKYWAWDDEEDVIETGDDSSFF